MKDGRALSKPLCDNLHTLNIASHRPSLNDRKEWEILKSLRRNRNIVILKPDKGNGIVVLDRATYDESGILKLITGSSKFDDKNLRPNVSK